LAEEPQASVISLSNIFFLVTEFVRDGSELGVQRRGAACIPAVFLLGFVLGVG